MKTQSRLPREERKRKLVSTAQELFGERGYRGAEIEELARRSGVTKPIIYRHFPGGKAQVFMAVLDEHISGLMRVLWEALASSTDPRERLHRGLAAYVRFAEENPDGFYLFAGASSELDPEIGTRLREVREKITGGLTSTISDVMRGAGLTSEGAAIYANALLGGADAVLAWWLESKTLDRETVVDYLLAFVWRGFDGLPKDPTRFHKREG